MSTKTILRSRKFFLSSVFISAMLLSAAASSGDKQKQELDAQQLQQAIKKFTGGAKLLKSEAVTLWTPNIAEAGHIVPVHIKSSLDRVEQVAVLVGGNPKPLAATYRIPAGNMSVLKSQVKMRGTNQIVAIVKANGKYYQASKKVKVTIGGCGGG